MPTVLHISASASTWWKKSSTGWTATSEPTRGYVGVVTDVAEETFVEISVPRVFGADRANYISRQLQSRFPDSKFRLALPPIGAGSLMDRLSPPLQTLAAVDPDQRIQSALQGLQVSIAGVWNTSLLLAQLGKSASLPANLFIVMSQAHSMRIVFLKQRSPVLTRLITASQSAAEQASEIIRTLRHLENTRVIERENQRFGVLLLGGADALVPTLAAERLDVLPPPAPWNKGSVSDWNHVLFDVAAKGPPGQLAPLSYRATYLARKWGQAARVAGVLCVAASVWLAGGAMSDALQARSAQAQVQSEIDRVASKVASLDEAIAAFGVSPELVRKAIAVDADEITSAPLMQDDMLNLSRIIASITGARLKSMQWQVLQATEVPCTDGASAGAARAQPAIGVEPARTVELQFSVLLPQGGGPRQLAQQTSEISRRLKLLKGIDVLQDPARLVREGNIQSGATPGQADVGLQWCVTLPSKS